MKSIFYKGKEFQPTSSCFWFIANDGYRIFKGGIIGLNVRVWYSLYDITKHEHLALINHFLDDITDEVIDINNENEEETLLELPVLDIRQKLMKDI